MNRPGDDADLTAAEQVLHDRIGLNPESLGRGPISQAVIERRRACALSPGTYAGVLAGSEEERQALVEAVVVPESWFFRDKKPFEFLAQSIAKTWRDHPARHPLRVLCLPCAGGEEPYSVAITLLDAGLTTDRFRLVAVDVSRRELERAGPGSTAPTPFEGVSRISGINTSSPPGGPGESSHRPETP